MIDAEIEIEKDHDSGYLLVVRNPENSLRASVKLRGVDKQQLVGTFGSDVLGDDGP